MLHGQRGGSPTVIYLSFLDRNMQYQSMNYDDNNMNGVSRYHLVTCVQGVK
jgi:hypothetical protein